MTHKPHRRNFKFTQKIREVKTKVISFINRTVEQLQKSMAMLLQRYKKVTIKRKLIAGMYSGYITVEYR